MTNTSKRFANWFPGQPAIQDRWGDLVGAKIKVREFQPAQKTASDASARIRWSLGYY